MTLLGSIALWLSLLLSVWGAGVGFAGAREARSDLRCSARRALIALCATLLVATACLAAALLRHDFNVAYVAAHSTRNLPAVYAWTALSAGPGGGALLMLGLWVASAGAGVELRSRGTGAPALVTPIVCLVVAVLVIALLTAAHPFARLPYTPVEGQGLDPALQEPVMLVQLPLQHAAAAALALACAVAMAARGQHAEWLAAARPWLWLAWLLLSLSLGLALAAAFAARGVWRWEAANPLALAAWLTVAGLLHVGLARRASRPDAWRSALAPAVTGVLAALALAAGGLGAAGVAAGGGSALVVALVARALAHYRTEHRYAAVTVHAGVAVLAAAFTGTTLRTQVRATLRPGESVTVRSPVGGGSAYTVTHLSVSRYPVLNHVVTAGAVEIARGNRRVALVSAERRQYLDVLGRPTFEPVGRAGIWNGLLASVSVSLAGVAERGGAAGTREGAAYRVTVTPFVSWVSFGGALVVAGAVLALLSRGDRRD